MVPMEQGFLFFSPCSPRVSCSPELFLELAQLVSLPSGMGFEVPPNTNYSAILPFQGGPCRYFQFPSHWLFPYSLWTANGAHCREPMPASPSLAPVPCPSHSGTRSSQENSAPEGSAPSLLALGDALWCHSCPQAAATAQSKSFHCGGEKKKHSGVIVPRTSGCS